MEAWTTSRRKAVMEAYFSKNMIAYELGEAAKAGRYPRRPADDLPLLDTGHRARPDGDAADAAEPDRAGWLVRFGRRLASTATMWSL
jgi:hypothetical protein